MKNIDIETVTWCLREYLPALFRNSVVTVSAPKSPEGFDVRQWDVAVWRDIGAVGRSFKIWIPGKDLAEAKTEADLSRILREYVDGRVMYFLLDTWNER